MKILVDKMPNKKEACLFYRKTQALKKEWCSLNGKSCSIKDENSMFVNCSCLKIMTCDDC